MNRDACLELDRDDPLRAMRDRFALPEGVIYLDGNSLGALPRSTSGRLRQLVDDEWGTGLIRSWTAADWIQAPRRIGDKISHLIGAGPGEVVAADSTSVNLFKLLAGAVRAQPERHFILTEKQNFPTDIYVAEGLCRLIGGSTQLRVVDRAQLETALDASVAVLTLTHVDFGTGALHNMEQLTQAAHRVGALVLWDLSHSAGAVPVDLAAAGVDLAVGCGYKFLNGGPGAPAFLFIRAQLQDAMETAIAGWMGHASPFNFELHYRPAAGVQRQLAGTPSIVALAALEAAIDLWLEVDRDAVWRKSRALGDLFIKLVDEAALEGIEVASPREAARRGSQISLRHKQGYAVMRALIDRGVIGDFRVPDILRFGLTPLYTRYVDVYDAVAALRDVIDSRQWDRPAYRTRLAVT